MIQLEQVIEVQQSGQEFYARKGHQQWEGIVARIENCDSPQSNSRNHYLAQTAANS
jgi:hypothetical protein